MDSIQVALPKVSIPLRRAQLLLRPRLLDFLKQHLDRKLILVAAPAGYGKTSLLTDLASQTTLPVAWYSLDPSDRDPRVFAEYLVAALARPFPDAFPQTATLLRAADLTHPRERAAFVATLVNEISAIAAYFVCVLDDFHCIDESDASTLLEDLLRLLPENMHLILASRVLPARLPLLRMAARQEIAGLNAADLRFRVEELQLLAQQNGWSDLDAARLAALVDFADGWITGILLVGQDDTCTLSQTRPFLRGETQLFDYFAAEVLARETPAVQEFLMQSAILDELTCEIVRALWGAEATERLAELERRNLFIARTSAPPGGTAAPGDAGVAWRYHALFRHFLLTRFRDIAPEDEQSWQMRAAEAFERAGQWDRAIQHYQRAGQLHRAAQAMDRAAEALMNQGRFQTLAGWIDSLPSDLLLQFPNLLLQRGLIFHRAGERARGEALLVQAQHLFRSREDVQGQVAAMVARAETFNTLGRLRESIDLLEGALRLMADRDACALQRARVHNALGIAWARLGELARGRVELEEAVRCHLLANSPPGELATAYHNLGAALTALGLPEAETHYLIAQRLYPSDGYVRMRVLTLNGLGVTYYYRGEYARAIEMLEPARDDAVRAGDTYAYCTVMASLADVRRDQGDLEQSVADYREALASAQRIGYVYLMIYAQTALAELDCRRGHLAAAENELAEAAEAVRREGSRGDELLVRLATGIFRRAQGDELTADQEFRLAAEIAQAMGARRELIRAELHLAVSDLRRDQAKPFRERMERIACLARELGETQMIVSEAPWVKTALDAAVARGIEADWYRGVLRRVAVRVPIAASVQPKPRVVVQAFGRAAVWVEGQPIPPGAAGWETTLAQDLFFLVLSVPAGLRKELLLDALWPDLPPAQALENLYRHVSRVRKVIPREYFFREGERYRVRREGLEYDVDAFERHLGRAEKAHNPSEQAEHLRAAVALYRGDYLDDCYADWASPIRTRLEQAFTSALLWLARLEEQLGRPAAALADYQRLFERDGCDAEVVRSIMRLRYQRGDRNGAVEIYRQHAEHLREELNAAPDSRTASLYQQILAGSSALLSALAGLSFGMMHVQFMLSPIAGHLRCFLPAIRALGRG